MFPAFLEMIRFSHTLFALPFALAGAVLAWRAAHRTKPFEILIDIGGIIPCMVLARCWAMAPPNASVAAATAAKANVNPRFIIFLPKCS